MRLKRAITGVALSTGAAALAVTMAANAAFASYNDSFSVSTTDGCGAVNFIDYGEGADGGGNNDDYLVIHDYCGDHHGVMAYAWIGDLYLGKKYNGNGLAGDPVVWDPFKLYGNIFEGDVVGIKACLVDGPDDPTASKCRENRHKSHDG
jgi:hypothetical protein